MAAAIAARPASSSTARRFIAPLPCRSRLAPRRPDRIGQELDIGGEQSVSVEVMVPLEQGAPKDRGERRRDQQLRKLAQARLAKLAALDAAVDQPGQRLDAARDHLVVIEFGELGMLVPFGDQQPRDEGALGADEFLEEGEERTLEKCLGRQRGRLHPLAHHVEMRGDHALDDRPEQRLLGLEVEIGQPLAHPRARGHVLEPGPGVALHREFLERRGDDLLRPCVIAPLRAAWRQGFRSSALLSLGPWLPSDGRPQYND